MRSIQAPIAATPDAPETSQADQLGKLAESWLPLVTGTTPILTAIRQLPEPARRGLPGADWMLLCPVTVKDRPTGQPLIGKIEKETWETGQVSWVLTSKMP